MDGTGLSPDPLLVALVPLMLLVLLKVVSAVWRRLFASMEVQIPLLTRVLLAAADFLKQDGVWIVLVILRRRSSRLGSHDPGDSGTRGRPPADVPYSGHRAPAALAGAGEILRSCRH